MATDIMTQGRTLQSATMQRPVVALPQQRVSVDVKEASSQKESAAAQQVAPSEQDIQEAMSKLTSHFQNIQRNLNFSVDEGSGRTVVKVIDADSQEVIRQFPTEEALALARRLRELSGDESGVLIQSKA